MALEIHISEPPPLDQVLESLVGLLFGRRGISGSPSIPITAYETVPDRVTSPLLSFFLGWMLRSLRLLPPMHPVYLNGTNLLVVLIQHLIPFARRFMAGKIIYS